MTASEERFDGFVREASPGLLRAAWLLVGDWPAAEDLVQTAFEKTWPRWGRLLDDKQRLAYLHRVLLGSYCGAPARAIEIPLDQSAETPLRVPLRGPQPGCEPATGASTLIDGIAGAPGEPVQPPRPDYLSLRLTGQIEPGTTSGQLAPIDLTLRTIGSTPVTLDPCPAYAGQDDATARSGGFGDPISSGYLPCTKHEAVIRPGHPLHWTIPATSLLQTPGTGAIPGSTVYAQLGIAGVPLLHLKTTTHR